MFVKKIGIVSLSSGILGESFVKHEVALGGKRLEDMGLEVTFLPHAQLGIDQLNQHPDYRAQDLLTAFRDDSIDMILCAIGGDDTYRLLPYLFDHNELARVVKPKIFLGFSDTTVNHLMLHQLGLKTFYGQAFLTDICELSDNLLPYTKHYFSELIETGGIKEIRPSPIWYEERQDFSPSAVGHAMPSHPDQGFIHLQGAKTFDGEILGGCLDSIYDLLNGDRYPNSPQLCQKYHLFPDLSDWQGKILLLETSEEKPSPEKFRQMIRTLGDQGIFEVISGLLFGKPQDQAHQEAYHPILLEEIPNDDLPIVANLNVGHATPRCIVPFGIPAQVDVAEQVIRFKQ